MNTGTTPNPWVYEAGDYQGNMIRITVTFDSVTRVLSGASVFRDPACVYHKIYIGLGGDGRPDSTPHVFTVPSGTTAINKTTLNASGFTVIEDVLALQITAGP